MKPWFWFCLHVNTRHFLPTHPPPFPPKCLRHFWTPKGIWKLFSCKAQEAPKARRKFFSTKLSPVSVFHECFTHSRAFSFLSELPNFVLLNENFINYLTFPTKSDGVVSLLIRSCSVSSIDMLRDTKIKKQLSSFSQPHGPITHWFALLSSKSF